MVAAQVVGTKSRILLKLQPAAAAAAATDAWSLYLGCALLLPHRLPELKGLLRASSSELIVDQQATTLKYWRMRVVVQMAQKEQKEQQQAHILHAQPPLSAQVRQQHHMNHLHERLVQLESLPGAQVLRWPPDTQPTFELCAGAHVLRTCTQMPSQR